MSNKFQEALDLSNEEDKNTYIVRLEDAYREHIEKIEKLETKCFDLDIKNQKLKKALNTLLNLSTNKENGICCTYNCPNKDEDIESGMCIGKCLSKEELKDYIFKEIERRNKNE